MSKCIKDICTCDYCSYKFEVDVWESVNVTLNPELRKKFVDMGEQTIFEFVCPNCGETNYNPYPTLYHDMDKRFMVKLDNIPNCIDYLNEFPKATSNFGNIVPDTYITCAFTPAMLKEKIVSLENGLDPRIVALSRIKALESLVNSFDPFSGNEIVSSYLGYYDGVLSYIAEVSDNTSVNLVHTPFEIEDYNYCLNQYKNLLVDTDEHFFSDVNAKRLLYLPNDLLDELRNEQFDYYILNQGFIKFPTFASERSKIGDQIVFSFRDRYYIGNITKKTNFNSYTLPLDEYDIGSVIMKVNTEFIASNKDMNDLDNQELLDKLKDSLNNNTNLPFDLLSNSDVIMNELVTENYLNAEGTGEPIIYRKLITKKIFDKEYICIYLEAKDMPNNFYTKYVFNFNDIVRISFMHGNEFDGIIINPDKDDICFTNNYILDQYIQCRVLSDEDKVAELLKSLSDTEIEAINKESYEVLKLAYLEGISLDEISKIKQIDIDETNRLLQLGLDDLRPIITFRF